MLLKRQHGKCLYCGLLFMPDDLLEVHHVHHDPNKQTFTLEALHRHCHDKVHGPKEAFNPEESVHDKN